MLSNTDPNIALEKIEKKKQIPTKGVLFLQGLVVAISNFLDLADQAFFLRVNKTISKAMLLSPLVEIKRYGDFIKRFLSTPLDMSNLNLSGIDLERLIKHHPKFQNVNPSINDITELEKFFTTQNFSNSNFKGFKFLLFMDLTNVNFTGAKNLHLSSNDGGNCIGSEQLKQMLKQEHALGHFHIGNINNLPDILSQYDLREHPLNMRDVHMNITQFFEFCRAGQRDFTKVNISTYPMPQTTELNKLTKGLRFYKKPCILSDCLIKSTDLFMLLCQLGQRNYDKVSFKFFDYKSKPFDYEQRTSNPFEGSTINLKDLYLSNKPLTLKGAGLNKPFFLALLQAGQSDYTGAIFNFRGNTFFKSSASSISLKNKDISGAKFNYSYFSKNFNEINFDGCKIGSSLEEQLNLNNLEITENQICSLIENGQYEFPNIRLTNLSKDKVHCLSKINHSNLTLCSNQGIKYYWKIFKAIDNANINITGTRYFILYGLFQQKIYVDNKIRADTDIIFYKRSKQWWVRGPIEKHSQFDVKIDAFAIKSKSLKDALETYVNTHGLAPLKMKKIEHYHPEQQDIVYAEELSRFIVNKDIHVDGTLSVSLINTLYHQHNIRDFSQCHIGNDQDMYYEADMYTIDLETINLRGSTLSGQILKKMIKNGRINFSDISCTSQTSFLDIPIKKIDSINMRDMHLDLSRLQISWEIFKIIYDKAHRLFFDDKICSRYDMGSAEYMPFLKHSYPKKRCFNIHDFRNVCLIFGSLEKCSFEYIDFSKATLNFNALRYCTFEACNFKESEWILEGGATQTNEFKNCFFKIDDAYKKIITNTSSISSSTTTTCKS